MSWCKFLPGNGAALFGAPSLDSELLPSAIVRTAAILTTVFLAASAVPDLSSLSQDWKTFPETVSLFPGMEVGEIFTSRN